MIPQEILRKERRAAIVERVSEALFVKFSNPDWGFGHLEPREEILAKRLAKSAITLAEIFADTVVGETA